MDDDEKYIQESEFKHCAKLDNTQLMKLLIKVTGYYSDDKATYIAAMTEVCKRLGVEIVEEDIIGRRKSHMAVG